MSFQWLRLWTDAIDDEKLKLLAFEDRWHFIAILCMKRKGILDAPDTHALRDRKVGAKLGLGDRDRDEVRNRLREVGLIDEHWQPLAWGKRQFVSDADPTALARKKRQREKQRHGRVTRDNRDSHGRDTDASRSGHAPQTQTQTQTTDSEKSERTPRRAARGTPQGAGEVSLHESLPRAEWAEWLEFRRKRRWPTDPTTLRKQLNVLATLDTEAQQQAIANSINSGWRGIFLPKGRAPKRSHGAPTVAELEISETRRLSGEGRTATEIATELAMPVEQVHEILRNGHARQ